MATPLSVAAHVWRTRRGLAYSSKSAARAAVCVPAQVTRPPPTIARRCGRAGDERRAKMRSAARARTSQRKGGVVCKSTKSQSNDHLHKLVIAQTSHLWSHGFVTRSNHLNRGIAAKISLLPHIYGFSASGFAAAQFVLVMRTEVLGSSRHTLSMASRDSWK